jgi:hypothetical protein
MLQIWQAATTTCLALADIDEMFILANNQISLIT